MSADWFLIATSATTTPQQQLPPSNRSRSIIDARTVVNLTGSQLEAAATLRQQLARSAFRRCNTATVMSPEEVRRSQKPYRYGMILLCFGALINWIGLAENYTEPIRYAGVACIVSGALLICTAMCCWLHTPPRTGPNGGAAGGSEANGGIVGPDGTTIDADGNVMHVIQMPDGTVRAEKPPEYAECVVQPPSYADALQQLSPAALLAEARAAEEKTAAAAAGGGGLPTYEQTTTEAPGGTASEVLRVVTVTSASVIAEQTTSTVNSTTTMAAGVVPARGTINVYHVMCSSAPPAVGR